MPLKRFDLYFNFFAIHQDATFLGHTHAERLRLNLTNEVLGLMGRLHSNFNRNSTTINEAYSTLASVLSILDPTVADTVMNGNAYEEIYETIGDEMDELARLGQK